MALGLGGNKDDKDDNSIPMENGKDFGSKNYYDGFTPDPEAQRRASAPRKMSRLDRPTTGSIAVYMRGRRSFDANAPDEDIDIGKQVEMESENAIKYRTCSWQKV